ncbi:hypothetical protein [Actinoplanes sp. G11-F43]|uniref:hypothetical protein n=1 Tax=Actinoplanes sp. G11-F43 TaxID=3424130 RepID=UPI003D358242
MDNGGFSIPRPRDGAEPVRGPWHAVDFDTLPPADILIEIDRVVPTLREIDPPAGTGPDFAAGFLETLDWAALTHPDSSPWARQPDLRRIGRQLHRIDGILARLPLPPDRLVGELTDIGACLDEITRACRGLGVRVERRDDTDEWITELDRAITELEHRDRSGSALPPPHLTLRDVRSVMFIAGDTTHVIHHCAVDRPVIEVATLVGYEEAGGTEIWFHGLEPPPGAGTRILRSHGVSVSARGRHGDVFEHRVGACPLSLGALVARPPVRRAVRACHGGDPVAATSLHTAVRQAVAAVDVSVLVPPPSPPDPGTRVRLAVRHGAGLA